VDNVGNSN